MTYGGRLTRAKASRNTTAEMYFSSGKRSNIGGDIRAVISVLLRRMRSEWVPLGTISGPTLPMGTRAVNYDGDKIAEARYVTRLNTIREKFKSDWTFDKANPYRAFQYLGSYVTEKKNPGGQGVNYVVKGMMWPWDKLAGVTRYLMTDTSTAAQQELLRKKIDVLTPDPPMNIQVLNQRIQSWLWKLMFKNKTPRIMSKEDFIKNVRSNAAVGGWCDEISWQDVDAAIQDPKFWRYVDEERERHLRGDCKWCVYNTMGKKEKKTSYLGRPKGSRVIWYLWLGGRFLEYEALGFLNQDHWVNQETLPCGVGQTGVQYLGYRIRDVASRKSTSQQV